MLRRSFFIQEFLSLVTVFGVGICAFPTLAAEPQRSISPQKPQAPNSTTRSQSRSLFSPQPRQHQSNQSKQRRTGSAAFKPLPGRGMPAATAGGASRGQCPSVEMGSSPLVALVPALAIPGAIAPEIEGLTVDPLPTFFFYVEGLGMQQVAFSLKDESNNDVYTTVLSLSEQKTGVMQVQLPPEISPLKVGQTYRWSFGILCEAQNPNVPSEVMFVTGAVQRIEPDAGLLQQLAQASPLEQAVLYAQNGIWFNSVKSLANLRQSQPDDPMTLAKWQELLQSVQLEQLATAPLL
ncbi:MAG: DUF928 domain-containing protein [Microcoleaceae cyanobacterium]